MSDRRRIVGTGVAMAKRHSSGDKIANMATDVRDAAARAHREIVDRFCTDGWYIDENEEPAMMLVPEQPDGLRYLRVTLVLRRD